MEALIDPGSDQILEGGGIVAAGRIRSFFDLNTISMRRYESRN
jgi:hypothetical protein